MSRILRRPMFRGGRVSSYGTGIAAPLVPGYRGGGQIGGGIIYGKPMADGRYGFEKPQKITVGADLLFKEPALNQQQWEEQQKWKNWKPEFQTESDIQSAYEQALEDEKALLDSLLIEGPLTPDKDFYTDLDFLQSKEGKKKFFQDTKKKQDEKIKKAEAAGVNVTTELNEQVDTPEINEDKLEIERLKKLLEERAMEPEVDAKTAVAENKELFRDLLGYKEAKGQDISSMLLGFAGAEGDDTWSKTKSFFRDEAKRPGKAEKISDAAGTLAIQDYIAGKRSKEQIEKLKGIEDYKKDKLLQTKIPQQTDTLEEASFKLTAAGISPTSPKGLKFLIGIKDDTGMADNVVSVSGIKIEELTDPGKTNKIIKKLKPGYNILDDEGVKRIILYDGSGTAAGIDVMTVSQFWSKK